MKKNFLLLGLIILFTTGMNSQSFYGDKIDNSNIESMDNIYSQLKKKETVTTKIEGTIVDVCSVKGCWMNVTDGNGHDFFVKFKDYGFFMPKDAAGQKVILQGMAYLEQETVEERRHYAEDAGKSKEEIEKITAVKINYHFLANGVMLMDKASTK